MNVLQCSFMRCNEYIGCERYWENVSPVGEWKIQDIDGDKTLFLKVSKQETKRKWFRAFTVESTYWVNENRLRVVSETFNSCDKAKS